MARPGMHSWDQAGYRDACELLDAEKLNPCSQRSGRGSRTPHTALGRLSRTAIIVICLLNQSLLGRLRSGLHTQVSYLVGIITRTGATAISQTYNTAAERDLQGISMHQRLLAGWGIVGIRLTSCVQGYSMQNSSNQRPGEVLLEFSKCHCYSSGSELQQQAKGLRATMEVMTGNSP